MIFLTAVIHETVLMDAVDQMGLGEVRQNLMEFAAWFL